MGIFHRATITPAKAELVAQLVATRSWGLPADSALDTIGAFRFDDPENRVGMETHLVNGGGTLFQVPLTYRDEPLDGADDAFVAQMEHSELGTRWVYDGLGDERFLIMLAAVAMTGQGEALGMVQHDGRWHIAPAPVRIRGGGWGLERASVDRFRVQSDDAATVVCDNDRFEMTFFRRPTPGPRRPMALTATWEGQQDPVVLARVRER